jgi:hypothetical protein
VRGTFKIRKERTIQKVDSTKGLRAMIICSCWGRVKRYWKSPSLTMGFSRNLRASCSSRSISISKGDLPPGTGGRYPSRTGHGLGSQRPLPVALQRMLERRRGYASSSPYERSRSRGRGMWEARTGFRRGRSPGVLWDELVGFRLDTLGIVRRD